MTTMQEVKKTDFLGGTISEHHAVGPRTMTVVQSVGGTVGMTLHLGGEFGASRLVLAHLDENPVEFSAHANVSGVTALTMESESPTTHERVRSVAFIADADVAALRDALNNRLHEIQAANR